ncbi:MAG: hypothetical protein OWS74_03450, partial [Firmicutes bacterium]|nr:hypothetical protein [Bacillota bacterium]
QRTDRRSVSAEHTSRHDLHSAQEISALFAQCAQEVSARSQEIQLVGNRVGIKWRTKDFHTYSKQTILPQATNDPRAILRVAWQLWQMRGEIRPIRLIGITLSGLQEPSQQMHFSF